MIILHILLLILKIIGIILLFILGLALLVLFFPITYKFQGEMGKDKSEGQITFGWLFHLIHLKMWFEGNKYFYNFRVFGIKFFSSTKKEKKPKEEEKIINVIPDKKEKDNTVKTTSIDDEEQREKEIDNSVFGEETEEECEESIDTEDESTETFKNRITNIFSKIKAFLKKIKALAVGIKNKSEKTFSTIKEWKEFLTANTTKEAFAYGKKKVIQFLKHIFPSSIKGEMDLGFESPDVTGKALGLIGIGLATFKVNPKKIIINPDFEKSVLNGRVKARGFFMLGVLIIYGLQFYFNKNINRIIKKFK